MSIITDIKLIYKIAGEAVASNDSYLQAHALVSIHKICSYYLEMLEPQIEVLMQHNKGANVTTDEQPIQLPDQETIKSMPASEYSQLQQRINSTLERSSSSSEEE